MRSSTNKGIRSQFNFDDTTDLLGAQAGERKWTRLIKQILPSAVSFLHSRLFFMNKWNILLLMPSGAYKPATRKRHEKI